MQSIQIHKFGGASVKNAEAVKALSKIVQPFQEKHIIVVSAMGKTTNNLEIMINRWFKSDSCYLETFNEIKEYHQSIIDDLFYKNCRVVNDEFSLLEELLDQSPSLDYNFEYDKIVSFGEIISTKIVAKYLEMTNGHIEWMDVRTVLKKDQTFKKATVKWELSSKLISKHFTFNTTNAYVTQGFIGSTKHNLTTTLGREGSDYTAAALAWLLNAQSVTVWKDVPGIMNADPKWHNNPVKIDHLSYSETVELSYFGAKVIHPKTLRPLQQKDIPLFVRSFVDPTLKGTEINNNIHHHNIPFYIRKENQILITLFPQDFTFMEHNNISKIQNIIQFTCKFNPNVSI